MSGSSKKPTKTRAQRSMRTQQIIIAIIGIILILSMVIGLVSSY